MCPGARLRVCAVDGRYLDFGSSGMVGCTGCSDYDLVGACLGGAASSACIAVRGAFLHLSLEYVGSLTCVLSRGVLPTRTMWSGTMAHRILAPCSG